MKNMILRTLSGAIFFSLISGVVVLVIGFMLGWQTSTQFSDGFFWAGVIMIAIGFISLQGYSQHRPVDWPPDHLDQAEHADLWAADALRGKKIMAFLEISGLLLFGLSYLAILIGRLF